MAWKIDRDYLTTEAYVKIGMPSRVGVESNSPALTGKTYRFRLRGDDGEIYYGGTFDLAALECADTGDDTGTGGLYEALEWGMYDAGATDLQLHRADALTLGLMSEKYADKYTTPDGWTSIYG